MFVFQAMLFIKGFLEAYFRAIFQSMLLSTAGGFGFASNIPILVFEGQLDIFNELLVVEIVSCKIDVETNL